MKGKLKSVVLLAAMASPLGATWADLPLDSHVKYADAIVKVRIVTHTSFFKTPEKIVTQWEALTDCGAGVLKDRHKPGDPPVKHCSTIVIETNGGRVAEHLIIDSSQPNLIEGQVYWLFLKRADDESIEIADGAINAFQVTEGKIRSINARMHGKSEDKFKEEVRQSIAQEADNQGKQP